MLRLRRVCAVHQLISFLPLAGLFPSVTVISVSVAHPEAQPQLPIGAPRALAALLLQQPLAALLPASLRNPSRHSTHPAVNLVAPGNCSSCRFRCIPVHSRECFWCSPEPLCV